jgi:two-component system LytT family response regulator
MNIQQKFIKPLKLKTSTGFNFYDYSEIVYIKADEHQTKVYLCSGEIITVFTKFTSIQEQLPGDQFYKCHRSFIINLSKVVGFNSKLRTISFDKYQIPVSRRSVKEFLGLFQHYNNKGL